MALNPEKVKLLYNKLSQASHLTMSSISMQLFNYLQEEVKDNPIYDEFEKERAKWILWKNNMEWMSWELPNNFSDAKTLAYSLYKSFGENKFEILDLSTEMFGKERYDDNIYEFNKTFIEYLGDALQDIINSNPEVEIVGASKTKGDLIFIIHGHDNDLKHEVQILMQNGGLNNVVLHEQVDKARTIIDKLIEETERAGYAIALLTPDDIVDNGKQRARQNVILEIGYFIGKLGKERIRMLVKDDIEIPSDLQGILYERFDSNGAWKIKILKEIQATGIYVDIQNAVNKF